VIRPLQISPSYSVEDWNRLDLTYPSQNENDWQKSFLIFEDRIRGRFLDIVENIQLQAFSGFVIMAIDCLLIETLEQFYQGVPSSVGSSQKSFTDFFSRSSVLDKAFSNDQKNLIYDHFRNGIFHQAELKGSSRVLMIGSLVEPAKVGAGLVINRKKFHEQLVCEFNTYIDKLRANNPVDQYLRSKFKAKMDYICRKPQYYFAFCPEITAQALQNQLGQVEVLGQATLIGWSVKTNKKGGWIGVKPDNNGQILGNVYRLSVEQLDNLPDAIEKDNKPIPVKVNCLASSQYPMVWVYSR
jgi:hypothetical protein